MFIQYSIHCDKRQTLKKIIWDKINVIENTLLFLSQALAHHSFTFYSQSLDELKHKVRLSLAVCGVFHF